MPTNQRQKIILGGCEAGSLSEPSRGPLGSGAWCVMMSGFPRRWQACTWSHLLAHAASLDHPFPSLNMSLHRITNTL